MVAGRCPQQLPVEVREELWLVHREIAQFNDFLQRGKGVANVCVDFKVTGVKCDQNTRLKMAHSDAGLAPELALRAHQSRLKLAALYRNHIHPIVMRSFGCIFAPFMKFLTDHSLWLFVEFISGATFGELFFPRQHVDPDAWYTVLVCLDKGRGVRGGDFGFSAVGWVLKCEDGDVLVYNGLLHHGTTEFEVLGPNDSRMYIALFVKRETVEAAALSAALRSRVGPQPVSL